MNALVSLFNIYTQRHTFSARMCLVRILGVPFGDTHSSISVKKSTAFFEDGDVVCTSPSSHCLNVAKQMSLPIVLSSLLAVSGENHKTDYYRRLPKSRLDTWVLQLPGASKLKEKWWPASYIPWQKSQVPKFITSLRKIPSHKTIVVVVTLDYAQELSNQLCAPTTASPPPMEAYEWSTFRLSGTTAPTVTILEQCAVLRAPNDWTQVTWDKCLEEYIRKYCDITKTPMSDMWTKAGHELDDFLQHEIQKDNQSAPRTYVNKFAEASMRCAECEADLYLHTLYDGTSGDAFCRKCGCVITSHQMDDGATFRTFEGEDDLNHHATSVDEWMSVETRLQTYQSVPDIRGEKHRGSTSSSKRFKLSQTKINKMMREDVQTRDEITTQETKDKQIQVATALYRRLKETPDVHLPTKTLRMAANIFHYKRNTAVSLQPVGKTDKHTPRDETLMQHIATALLAAATHHKPPIGDSALQYVPKTMLSTRSWQSKRGEHSTLPIALGKKRKVAAIRTTDPRPDRRRRMTCVATMQDSVKALTERRAARALA